MYKLHMTLIHDDESTTLVDIDCMTESGHDVLELIRMFAGAYPDLVKRVTVQYGPHIIRMRERDPEELLHELSRQWDRLAGNPPSILDALRA